MREGARGSKEKKRTDHPQMTQIFGEETKIHNQRLRRRTQMIILIKIRVSLGVEFFAGIVMGLDLWDALMMY